MLTPSINVLSWILAGPAVAAAAGEAALAAPPAPAIPAIEELEPGITLQVYEVGRALETIAQPIDGISPNFDTRRDTIDFAGDDFGLDDGFIAIVSGYVLVEQPGMHTFRLTSDDGSMLLVDGERVVSNLGLHAAQAADGGVHLDAGLHHIRIHFFENDGEQALSLAWKTPAGGEEFVLVPGSSLFTEKNITRVTSPGVKKVTSDVAGMRAGDGFPLEGVHPGWALRTIHPDDFAPMVGAMTTLPDGRLVVATFEPRNNGVWVAEPNGELWVLGNLGAEDSNDITVEKFADGFVHPLGMCVVDGVLYVAQRDEITKMEDRDGDGEFESRSTLASGWVSDNYHHFTFGLAHHDGFLYATLSTSIGIGEDEVLGGEVRGINGPNPPNRGTLMKIDIATGAIEYVCGGFRTPNGIAVLDDGTVLVGENQGAWMPASKINHARPGCFFGHYNETRARTTRYPEGGHESLFADREPTPPVVWLPQNEICNSPTAILPIRDGKFAGQVYIGELKLGGIQRASLERVNGVLQGAVFRSSQGFEGGINRLEWGPDGSIYVGCIGEQATWSWRGTRTGLQQLVPSGVDDTFEFHSIHATPSGFELYFTRPVEREQLEDESLYSVAQWRYIPTPDYGGPKVDEERLVVSEAFAGPGGNSVFLIVPGLKPGRCVHLRADPTSADGRRMWSPEAWYTLNEIPGYAAPETSTAHGGDAGMRLLVFSKTAGYRHASIADGVAMMQALANDHKFVVESTEDATIFNDADLARFDVVCFMNTSGDILDLSQEAAMMRFIRAGGGFVGVHAASDTEHDWPWYGKLVGAHFRSHPAIQPGRIMIVAPGHPATEHLGAAWEHTDEWYDFKDQPAGVDVLLAVDESTYEGGAMGARHPIAWTSEFDGGRAFYTAIGHTAECYSDPKFIAHIWGGLRWAAGIDAPDRP